MAQEKFGYNIVLLYDDGTNEKIFAGTTNNTFQISVETQEALTKADTGAPRQIGSKVTGSISISGILTVNEAGEETGNADKDDILDLVLAKEPISFIYGGQESGDTQRHGKVLLNDYSEDTDSEALATYSVSGQISGEITKVVVS